MKKTRCIAMLIIFIMLFSSLTVNASSSVTIDIKKAEEGIVRISYNEINKKTKVMVEKDSIKYYYDLKNDGEFFPLQLGQGRYIVSVLENTSGNKYKVIATESFEADISEENSVYLKSTQPISWNEDMEAIKLAESLTQDEQDQGQTVQVLYDYVVNNISYDYEKVDNLSSDYIPDIDTVLKDGKGICYDYSALLGAMLRSRGIPAKLVKGYREDINAYHAWNEVYIDGTWKVIDATYDAWALKTGTSHNMFQDANEYNKLKEY